MLWRKRLVEGLLGLLWELGFEWGWSKRLFRSGRVGRECCERGGVCRNDGEYGCVRYFGLLVVVQKIKLVRRQLDLAFRCCCCRFERDVVLEKSKRFSGVVDGDVARDFRVVMS